MCNLTSQAQNERGEPMLPIERQNEMYTYICANGSASVRSLAKRFNVSGQTVRRDLKILEQRGQVVTTHGGAYLQTIEFQKHNVDFELRRSLAVIEKNQIAALALPLLSNKDLVYFDNSTTLLTLAELLVRSREVPEDITVVTNSLSLADAIKINTDIELLLLGGKIDKINDCCVGIKTFQELEDYHFDKAFLTCSSLTLEVGLSDSSRNIAQIRKHAIERASEVILLADHTKFDSNSNYPICSLDRVNVFITDRYPGAKWEQQLIDRGVKLLFPKEG